MTIEIGERVVVSTPDRREFTGRLTALRHEQNGRQVAVVRLDTGWETTYPIHMVRPESESAPPE